MEKQDLLLRLLEETSPLKKTLASDPIYKRLRYTYEDILGFMDDKLIHVFLKYKDTHPYEEMKAIALTSLYRVRPRLFRQHPILLEEAETALESLTNEEDVTEGPDVTILMESLKPHFTTQQLVLINSLVSPPSMVIKQVKDFDTRIPSRLFLDYFGIPNTAQNIKKLNRFRKRVAYFIRNNIDPKTLKPRKNNLSLV